MIDLNPTHRQILQRIIRGCSVAYSDRKSFEEFASVAHSVGEPLLVLNNAAPQSTAEVLQGCADADDDDGAFIAFGIGRGVMAIHTDVEVLAEIGTLAEVLGRRTVQGVAAARNDLVEMQCYRCRGAGILEPNHDPCPTCSGSGIVIVRWAREAVEQLHQVLDRRRRVVHGSPMTEQDKRRMAWDPDKKRLYIQRIPIPKHPVVAKAEHRIPCPCDTCPDLNEEHEDCPRQFMCATFDEYTRQFEKACRETDHERQSGPSEISEPDRMVSCPECSGDGTLATTDRACYHPEEHPDELETCGICNGAGKLTARVRDKKSPPRPRPFIIDWACGECGDHWTEKINAPGCPSCQSRYVGGLGGFEPCYPDDDGGADGDQRPSDYQNESADNREGEGISSEPREDGTPGRDRHRNPGRPVPGQVPDRRPELDDPFRSGSLAAHPDPRPLQDVPRAVGEGDAQRNTIPPVLRSRRAEMIRFWRLIDDLEESAYKQGMAREARRDASRHRAEERHIRAELNKLLIRMLKTRDRPEPSAAVLSKLEQHHSELLSHFIDQVNDLRAACREHSDGSRAAEGAIVAILSSLYLSALDHTGRQEMYKKWLQDQYPATPDEDLEPGEGSDDG